MQPGQRRGVGVEAPAPLVGLGEGVLQDLLGGVPVAEDRVRGGEDRAPVAREERLERVEVVGANPAEERLLGRIERAGRRVGRDHGLLRERAGTGDSRNGTPTRIYAPSRRKVHPTGSARHRRFGWRAAVASSSRRTGAVCGALFTSSGSSWASRAISSMAVGERVERLEALGLGRLDQHPLLHREREVDRGGVEALVDEPLGDVEGPHPGRGLEGARRGHELVHAGPLERDDVGRRPGGASGSSRRGRRRRSPRAGPSPPWARM